MSDSPKCSRALTSLFRTESGALYAQDADGHIYRNGQLTFSGALIAVAVPQSPDGKLAVGCRAFLLIDHGDHLGWRITTRITELFAEPIVPTMPEGWRWDPDDLLALIR